MQIRDAPDATGALIPPSPAPGCRPERGGEETKPSGREERAQARWRFLTTDQCASDTGGNASHDKI